MSIRTLMQATLCGVLAVLPAGSLFGMPFVCPPAQENPWQEVLFTPTLFEPTATGLVETPPGISSPASPLDTLPFEGEVSSLRPKDRGLNPIQVSSNDGGLLLSRAFADTGWKRARQAKGALASGQSLEAWRAALGEATSPLSPQDAREHYSLFLLLAGLLLLTVGAVVRKVRQPLPQRAEPRLVSKPNFPVWNAESAAYGRVKLNNHPKAPIPPLEP